MLYSDTFLYTHLHKHTTTEQITGLASSDDLPCQQHVIMFTRVAVLFASVLWNMIHNSDLLNQNLSGFKA